MQNLRSRMAWILSSIACAALVAGAQAPQPGKFRSDDPLMRDPDNLSIPQPLGRPLSKMIDLLQKTFLRPGGGERQAQNVNTLGEVPNSSWFTNRVSDRLMTIEELVTGPNRGQGPDMSEPWLITAAKTEGTTPGFTIQDALGDTYLLKFGPIRWPQMATSADVIGTKFFHAFGYNVPENYLVHWRPDYELDQDVEVTFQGQVEVLSDDYVEDILQSVPRRPDGTVQVLASKFLPGKPIGPFDFQETRKDDPNDLFPHEDRRELRGMRIFAAWLNHNDSDSVNTLDMYHTDEQEQTWVKHYLIDFGTVMGSGAVQPHARRVGNEYYIEFLPAFKSGATLGLLDRPWRRTKYQEYPAVGRFESSFFEPGDWKPDYPNPAFDKMTWQDALWATRTVARFSDEAVRAIVRTGLIDDPAAEDYLVSHLIERRDKIVRYYLSQINPVDQFGVSGSGPGGPRLDFVNLGLVAGMASECRYDYTWHKFDNQSGNLSPLGQTSSTTTTRLPVPIEEADFLVVRLASHCSGQPKWTSPVDVYLRNGENVSVVGVERADPD